MSASRTPRFAARGVFAGLVLLSLLSAPTSPSAQPVVEPGTQGSLPSQASERVDQEAEGSAATDAAATEAQVAANASLTLRSDVFSVAVGEPFVITLELTGAGDATLLAIRATDEPHLRLTTLSDVTQPDGSHVIEVEAVLYRPGTFRIASLNGVLLDASGTQTRLESAPLAIEVSSSIINEPDAEPVGSPRPFPVLTTDYLPVILGSALLLLLIGGIIGTVVRRRHEAARLAAVPPPPPPPAWETALGALSALEHSLLLDEERHLEFHMRLSEIFRTYIGDRFAVLAIEATTEEIRQALRERSDSVGEWEPEIMRMLNEMDVVKFAKGTPTHDQSDELLLKTREFVLELSSRDRAVSFESVAPSVTRDEPEVPNSDDHTNGGGV